MIFYKDLALPRSTDLTAVGQIAVRVLDLDRAEVVKGAYSALYGSNALGGVVNLLTGFRKEQNRRFEGRRLSEIAAALAGVGGALTALAVGHVDPEMAYWTTSGEFVFVAILSGTASVAAPFAGALLLELLRSFAYEHAPNTWQLVMGATMLAVILFLPEGRMAVVITGDGRKAPTTNQDRVSLFNSLVAYTGPYRVDGDKWIITVDVSTNPALVGTEQTRFFRVTGDRLQEMTAWAALPDKRMARTFITYEREK